MAYCCDCSPLWWSWKRKIKLIRYSGDNLKTMKFTFASYLLLIPDILPYIYIYKYMTTRRSTASLTTSLHNINLQIINVSPSRPQSQRRSSNIFQTMTAGSITSTIPLTTSLHNIHLPNRQPRTSSSVSPHPASTNTLKYIQNNDNERYQYITNHHLTQQHSTRLGSCQTWRWADW